jgi:hypothetical protein
MVKQGSPKSIGSPCGCLCNSWRMNHGVPSYKRCCRSDAAGMPELIRMYIAGHSITLCGTVRCRYRSCSDVPTDVARFSLSTSRKWPPTDCHVRLSFAFIAGEYASAKSCFRHSGLSRGCRTYSLDVRGFPGCAPSSCPSCDHH